MLLKFTKMHGVVDDFMVVNGVTQKVFFSPELIKRLSNRYFGIGFDKLILVEPPYDPEVDFHYQVFDSEGKEVEASIDSAQCFTRFVVDHHLINKQEIKASSSSSSYNLRLNDDDTVTVNLGSPDLYEKINIEKNNNPYIDPSIKEKNNFDIGFVSFIKSYYIVFVDRLENIAFDKFICKIENSPNYSSKFQIIFAQAVNPHNLKVKAFSRDGKETKLNQFGFCSACVFGMKKGYLSSPVKNSFLNGDIVVSWDGDEHPLFITSTLERVFEGVVSI